jgi:hypothetical protein
VWPDAGQIRPHGLEMPARFGRPGFNDRPPGTRKALNPLSSRQFSKNLEFRGTRHCLAAPYLKMLQIRR